ncbi:putative membrane protein [[Clostridium] sordellii ATCC 9714]|nr:putative membrane protein [[Clostridium] sordellii ATCC 9714] [Paeniclostridium sordellii ATCC 9714]
MELAFQAGSAIAIVFPILLLLGIPISVTIGIASIFGVITTYRGILQY